MNKRFPISRRHFLKVGGGALAATAGARALSNWGTNVLNPAAVVDAAAAVPDYHLGGTDGWIALPTTPTIPTYHPDSLAPSPFTTYIFGFRNLNGLTDTQIADQKNKAQASAPIMVATENTDFLVKLTNLGLALRPDLVDSHTMHWHGFRNAIPLFDGEPSSSLSVPIGRNLTYYFRPRNPGTYMYHCHFEDTEHVHMGMTGVVFVRPTIGPKFAYNDASTAFDREYVMFLSEVWAEAHWADAHIQLPDWTDYKPDFWLLNGRVYPDTLAPNAIGNDASGDLNAPAGSPHLQRQPISSLVQANAGEKVLLRFVNLGYQKQAMTLPGIKMNVIAKDATLLKNGSANMSYLTNTISIGPGESVDAIFTAPAVTSNTTYLLYNREYDHLNNAGGVGYGGQMTEVRIRPSGVPAQTDGPNT